MDCGDFSSNRIRKQVYRQLSKLMIRSASTELYYMYTVALRVLVVELYSTRGSRTSLTFTN